MRSRPRTIAHDLIRRLPLWPVAALVAVGLVTAAAFADTSGYQKRIDAIEAKAAAARARLKLDTNSACIKYPTPEMNFASVATVKAGHTVTVRATGHFTKGTEFVFQSDKVTVKSAHVTATSATIVAHVEKGALPGKIPLIAITPVCGSQSMADGIVIETGTEWKVTMKNGWHLHLVADGLGDGVKCGATWSHKGRTRQLPCKLDGEYAGHYEASLGSVADQQELMNRQMKLMKDPGIARVQAKMSKVVGEMEKCSSISDQTKQLACIHSYGAKVNAMTAEMKAAQASALANAMKGVFGCLDMTFDVTGEKVTASGKSCGDPDELDGTGTMRVR